MTHNDEFIGLLESYLDEHEGSTPLPEGVRDVIRAELPMTRQRPPWWPARRFPEMNSMAKLAVAAAAVVVAALLGFNYVATTSSVGGPGLGVSPSPTPTAAPPSPEPTGSPSPSPIDTSAWTPFVSERYGLSLAHPDDWSVEPGDHDWTLETDAAWPNTAAEKFSSADGHIAIAAWSVAVDPDTTLEEWIQTYCEVNTTPCTGIQDRAVSTAAGAGGQEPGLLVPFEGDIQAFFLSGDRIYVVASWRPPDESDSQRLIEGFVSTLCLGCSS